MRVHFACVLLLAGCSTDFVPQTCAVDNDCGDGLVCETQGSTNVCVHAEDAPLIIGESAPISGTNQALGTGMKLGIELAFGEQNAMGGIRGRQLQLDFRDDAYQPNLAETNARALTDAQTLANQSPKCPSSCQVVPSLDVQAAKRRPSTPTASRWSPTVATHSAVA